MGGENQHKNKISVAEMRMSCKMCGKSKTRRDVIGMPTLLSVGVAPMVKTLQLKWFGHVERRTVDSVVRIVDQMEGSEIARFRGKPRKT